MAGKIVADAAVMVADAALNGVFQGLSQALTPIIEKKLGQFWGVDDKKLKKLKRYILGVQPLLNDAETQQFTDEAVRSWVSDLRVVAYDMEDIVDEMNTELLRLELEETKKSEGKQVGDFISYLRGSVENCSFNYQIAGKINEVLEKWEEIVEYGDSLHLRDGNIGGRPLEVIGKRRETTCLVVKSGVIGREIEKGKILSFLKSDKSSARSGNLSVIAIVGMGGLGKTTLAKLVYNEAVGFDTKGWIHVSHEFDCARVTTSIIESITNALCELRVLDTLQRRLEELMRNKKVLLVLDDAWTENPDDWVNLTMPLRSALKGSKIIVTTRSEVVSKSVGVDEMYKLKPLSDDDCWVVVKEKLLGCNNITDGNPHLEKVRVEVVKKCKGLALTANMLGGLLSTMEIDKWVRLLKSEIWDLPKTKVDILPALMLSYLYFPSHIKRYFAYTAIFPKGEWFRKDKWVCLWMAEGFIEATKSDTLEDTGNDYFDHLVARHFLQKLHDDFYVMHDLIHDLAEEILGSIFLRMEKEVVTNTPKEVTRYMFLENIVIDKTLLRNLCKAKSVHTLWVPSIDNAVFDELIASFEHLHVLDLFNSLIQVLPESIGKLKYIRYLNLGYNDIKRLPDSICGLYNLRTLHLDHNTQLDELPKYIESIISLQHLTLKRTKLRLLLDSICKLKKLEVIDLSNCHLFTVLPIDIGSLINLRCLNLCSTNIQRLPNSIFKLHNLRFLYLSECRELSELPKEMTNLINLRKLEVDQDILKSSLLPIGRFPNLQGLKDYFVSKENGIELLCDLANLHEKLNIMGLENVQSVEEARTANLKDKYGTRSLGLQWSCLDPLNLRDENVEAGVLEALEPPCAELRHLVIENYGGFKFPSWMGNTSFSKLVDIKLIDCRKAKLFAPLGQLPSLEKLVIEGMYELKRIGREVFGNGSFPSLWELQLNDLPNLEGRFEVQDGDFLHLIELEIWNCPKITLLPIAPLTLRALRIYGCEQEIGFAAFPVLPSLEEVEVDTSLQDGLLQPLTNLKRLTIKNCTKLSTLPDDLPATLSVLFIVYCPKLRSLPKGLQNITSLSVRYCPLIQVLQGELTNLTNLQHLMIQNCDQLISLSNGLPSSLISLVINSCAELTSLPVELPSSLEHLCIQRYPKIKSLPKGLHKLTSLRDLTILDSPLIESFPEDGLPTLDCRLNIGRCPTLVQRCLLQGNLQIQIWEEEF